MEKTSVELRKQRGERVKYLLKKADIKQVDMAEAIGYTPEHFSAIVNGRRNLTVEAAKAIANEINKRKDGNDFPVRYQWIMCLDDLYADTGNDEQAKRILKIVKASLDRFRADKAIADMLKRLGVYVDYAPEGCTASEWFDNGRQWSLNANDGETLCIISNDDKERLFKDIFDFTEFKIGQLLRGRG